MRYMDRRGILKALPAAGLLAAAGNTWPAVPARGAPLWLAQVASQTNPSAATNSRGMYLGMKALFDQVNAAGGIDGRPIQVSNHDDNLTPARMVEITNKTLVPDPKVLALIGYINTGGLTALAKEGVFAKSGIAMIAPLQGDHQVIDAENVFPFRAGYADEVNALVEHAKTMSHRRLAIMAYSIAFGPAMAKVAEEAARRQGLEVSVTMVDADPARIEQNMAQAASKVAEFQPSAVMMLCAGSYATEFAQAIRLGPAASAQLYCISVVLADNLVQALGAAKARGIVLSQAVPFPLAQGYPMVLEYQRVMKTQLPQEPLSFATLEGFAAAKIAVEALRRAGANPTRESIVQALNNAGEINLGGIYVKYAKAVRHGWRKVDLTIIDAAGKLVR